MTNSYPKNREGLTWEKIKRFLTLPFFPAYLKTFKFVKQFTDISLEELKNLGIRGILLDADGTLGPHHAESFSEPVIQQIQDMIDQGFKVAIFTNASEERFQQIPDVPIVTNVPPKPDPLGFKKAMEDYLNLKDPSEVCMIGDNYLTDGGAIKAGMKFIHVLPIQGNENYFHRLTRTTAYWLAQLYSPKN